MSYFISYCDNWQRVIRACIIEVRASIPAIKNQSGIVINDYVENQLGQVTDGVLPYRIETEKGVLVGYFAINVIGTSVVEVQKVLRPAFQGDSSIISGEITNFINGSYWRRDYPL